MSTASTRPSAVVKSATTREGSTPVLAAQARRSGDTSAAHTGAPSSESTRRGFSPPRPQAHQAAPPPASPPPPLAAQILDHLVAEVALRHPAHDEEILECAEGPVGDPVLGFPEAPRPVVDGPLEHAEALHPEERGNEAVEPAVEREPPEAFAAEGPEGAATVLDRIAADRVPDPVGDAGGDLADPRILPARPPARHRVPPVQVTEQRRDVVGVVLEVRIHGDDPAPAGRLEPGVGGRRLSRVDLEPDEPHAGIALAESTNRLRAPVPAPIVHEDDLVAEAGRIEDFPDLRPEERQVGLLVVHGDDQGEIEGGAGGALRHREDRTGAAGAGWPSTPPRAR